MQLADASGVATTQKLIMKETFYERRAHTKGDDNLSYLPHGFSFLCSLRGSNLIFHAHCLLSKKLVAVSIVTIADNNSKTIQYIFPSGE